MLKNRMEQKGEKATIGEQVLELYNEFGMPIQEIAEVLGKSRNNIDAQISALRKAGKIGKKEAPETEAELQEDKPVAAVAVQPIQ
ncbi:sigma-70 region 4 domain-containing protein [Candidatus Woesearchaeota archaeon]|nr:sigma-70 region 4 domain-containing protein [Candidatus Woesearchaeota archaeon]